MSLPQPLRSEFAEDPEMRELVDMFVAELPERIGAMRAAWAGGELDKVQHIAHQLRGSGGGYGFPSIGEAASRVEDAIRRRTEAGIKDLQRELDDLATLCQRASAR